MNTQRTIVIEDDFAKKVEGYRALLFEANVKNSETSESLKSTLDSLAEEIAKKYKIEEINKIPCIRSTREAYKACGKDPNRYRPSQEQLMRRIVRGLGLYNVNTLVDAGNIISLKTGCSVGCFDADKIEGDVLSLGIGKKDEPYIGIGRGNLNIEGLPVFRDAVGGIGTPTSDNDRTKLSLSTSRLLVTVHLFNPETSTEDIVKLVTDTFSEFGEATDFSWKEFSTK